MLLNARFFLLTVVQQEDCFTNQELLCVILQMHAGH